MERRRVFASALGLLLFASSNRALAQLAPPNDLGVALGDIHLAVKDVESQRLRA